MLIDNTYIPDYIFDRIVVGRELASMYDIDLKARIDYMNHSIVLTIQDYEETTKREIIIDRENEIKYLLHYCREIDEQIEDIMSELLDF